MSGWVWSGTCSHWRSSECRSEMISINCQVVITETHYVKRAISRYRLYAYTSFNPLLTSPSIDSTSLVAMTPNGIKDRMLYYSFYWSSISSMVAFSKCFPKNALKFIHFSLKLSMSNLSIFAVQLANICRLPFKTDKTQIQKQSKHL